MADKKIHRKPTTLKKGWLEILNTMLNKKMDEIDKRKNILKMPILSI